MEDLIRNVEYFIEKDGLKKRCRKPCYTHRRMYFYSILRDAGLTYRAIAEMFGGYNHGTIIQQIARYKALRKMKDKLLLLDIADYDGKIQLYKKTYDQKKDILKATTITDLDIIKGRVKNNLYNELN